MSKSSKSKNVNGFKAELKEWIKSEFSNVKTLNNYKAINFAFIEDDSDEVYSVYISASNNYSKNSDEWAFEEADYFSESCYEVTDDKLNELAWHEFQKKCKGVIGETISEIKLSKSIEYITAGFCGENLLTIKTFN